ncbi:hypothetical protein Tco_0918100 [Tanacetum coccineum]
MLRNNARKNNARSNAQELREKFTVEQTPGLLKHANSPQIIKIARYIAIENFSTLIWGLRLGSRTATPNGEASAMDSGSANPCGYVLGSIVGSGSFTPNGNHWGSRLCSSTLTLDGGEPYLMKSQISKVASLAKSAMNYPKKRNLN